jgi:fibronectin-binding autotransporter adhesin
MHRTEVNSERSCGRGTKASRRRRLQQRPTLMELGKRTLLSNFMVASTADDGSANTLRWAINQANESSQADTIAFSDLFDAPQTITLTLGPLTLTSSATTTITGPGANLLTVSGAGKSRVFDVDGATVVISGLTVSGGGSADKGGGLRNDSGALTLANVAISGNVATDQGGGLATQFNGSTILVGCTVSGNTAANGGGGVLNASSTTSLTNSTITGNTATSGPGGGLECSGGTTTLINDTVTANAAGTGGGGGGVAGGGTATLTNTIVAANTNGDIAGAVQPGSANNLVGNGSGMTGITSGSNGNQVGTQEAPIDAKLSTPGDYGGPTLTFTPLPGSQAKGGGTATGAPQTDQRGQPRSGPIDIGAFQTHSVITVNTTLDGVGSGPEKISLRQAINLADALTSVDTIDFDSTVFATPRTIALTAGQLTLTDKATTTINGPGANLLTVSGGGASRVIAIDTASAAISGLTITGGHLQASQGRSVQSGGGIWNFEGTLDLSDATVTGNFAEDLGGGIYTLSGTTSLTDVTVSQNTVSPVIGGIGGGLASLDGTTTISGGAFEGNSAYYGGGLYHGGNGTLTLANVTVSGNSAKFGGGIGNESGTLTMADVILSGNSAVLLGGGCLSGGGTSSMTNVTVSGNTSGQSGGGLFNSKGSATLTSCTLSGNTAQVGAGLSSLGYDLTLTNSTVSGNTASQQGAGVYSSSGTVKLISCTVSANSAPTGGGLVNSLNAATVTLTNTIVAGQKSGGDIAGALQPASANNLIGNGSGMTGISNESDGNQVGTAQAPIDPKLSPLGDYGGLAMTMVPLPGSLATGGGTSGLGTPTTDERGFARGQSVDIGAFQGEGKTLVVNTTVDGVGSGPGQLSLRQAITLANVEPTLDPIEFDATAFETPQTITLAGTQLELANSSTNITITGPAVGVTVSGGGRSRVFEVDAGVTASISGLTITGGNTAGNGGGLYNDGGNVTLTDCTVSGNSSTIFVSGGGGGGVRGAGGTTTLTNCTFSRNSAVQDGGGLSADGGTMTLSNCTISGNSAGLSAGGLFTFGGSTLTLSNCTVSGNLANYGGGLDINGSTVTLTNCTVSGNAATQGGGLWVPTGNTTTLTNTIVAGQAAGGDIEGALQAGSANNLVGDGSEMSGITSGSNGNQVGTAQAPIDPLLSPLGNYGGPTQTVALLPGSPAIGGGITGTGIPTTDQRGQQRSGHVDIGAFQSGGFTLALVVGGTPQSAVIGTTFSNTLAVMVTANNPLEPVDGGAVSFTASQVGGSSADLSSATATIVGGVADLSATANNVPGTYTVTATAVGAGSSSVSFTLTNTEFPGLEVNTTQDVVNSIDGTTSLREAIDYSLTLAAPSTITFSPAVFGSTPQTIVLALGELSLSNPATITIVGPGAGLLTVSGNLASRVFEVTGSAALSGLTITQGGGGQGAANSGAGLRNDHGTLSLIDCTITGNGMADDVPSFGTYAGGGLYANGGTTSLTDCTVSGNTATNGGGLYANGSATSLTNCTVSGNTAQNGGGLYIQHGTIAITGSNISSNTGVTFGAGIKLSNVVAGTLTDCTISNNNIPGGFGGGVCGVYSTLTLTDCTISGNSAAAGGGVENVYGNATLTNCTISGNTAVTGTAGASGRGGGLQATGHFRTTLINCTISGNSASTGGGVDFYSGTLATLINTIVAGQKSGGDIAGTLQPDSTNNLIGGNPLLAPLGDYGGPTQTMPPLAGSNAIGGGTTGTGVPLTDQRGFARGASIDIGAFQTQGTTLEVNVTSDGVGSGPGQLSLRQAVNIANVQTTGDSISFDPSVFATSNAITLTAGPLSLTDAARTTIAGPGASLLTISGGALSRVFDIPGGSAALSGMTITDGQADNGGGLRNAGGTLALTNVSVNGNVASNDGGGLYTAPGGSTKLTGVTISNNTASVGGGGAVGSSATSTLTNCTISGNTATSSGGGVANLGGTLSMTNVTVSNNHAGPPNGTGGGGLYIPSSGNVTLRNTIVAGNLNGDVAGALQPGSENNLIGGNPLLAPLSNYGGPTPTMPLLPGSAAIGGGSSGFGVPTTDQRGLPRAGRVDIGAFESQGFIITTIPGSTPQSVQVGTPFKNPLAAAVTASNPIEPVNGGVVSFVVNPGHGASATLSSPAAIIAGGRAAVNAMASATPGPYSVTASATGAGATSFVLSNIEIPGLKVTTLSDVVNATDGLTSLREAIAYANIHPGRDVITFARSALGSRPRTIRLNGGSLVLTDRATTTIVGPGARLLKIDSAPKSRVFDVRGGSLDLSRLTITGGRAHDGGLRNDGGRLTMRRVILRGNSARADRSGLRNKGSAALANVIVTGSSAARGGIANLDTLPGNSATIRGSFARFARDLFNSLSAGLIRRVDGPIRGR